MNNVIDFQVKKEEQETLAKIERWAKTARMNGWVVDDETGIAYESKAYQKQVKETEE